jgi:hypothetical protein
MVLAPSSIERKGGIGREIDGGPKALTASSISVDYSVSMSRASPYHFVTHKPPLSTCPAIRISWTVNLVGSPERYRETSVQVPGKRRPGLMWDWDSTLTCCCVRYRRGSVRRSRFLHCPIYILMGTATPDSTDEEAIRHELTGPGAFVMNADSGQETRSIAHLASCANDISTHAIDRFRLELFAFLTSLWFLIVGYEPLSDY